jgi:adenylate cyclase
MVGKHLRYPPVAGCFLSAIVFLAVVAVRQMGYMEFAELAVYDWYVRFQSAEGTPEDRLVLVEVSENDIHDQGRWPLTDGTVARVLETLLRSEPRAIGLDIYRDVSVPPGTKALEKVLQADSRVVAVMKFADTTNRGIDPPMLLRETDRFGFNDFVVDSGGTVRRGLLFLDDGKNVFHSFGLRLALLSLAREGIFPQADPVVPEYIRLGKTTIPRFSPNDGAYIKADARGYQFLIDYSASPSSIQSFSLSDVIKGRVPSSAIRDKIVLIGTSAEGVKDFFYTPYSRGTSGNREATGVSLHATIVRQLLDSASGRRSPLRSLPDWCEWLWILGWGLVGTAIGLLIRSPLRLALVNLSGLVGLALVVFILFLARVWLPLVPSALAWVLSGTLITAYLSAREKHERATLMQLFSRHVAKEIAEVLWNDRDKLLENGKPRPQKLVVTIMFTDFQGFTSVAEKTTPQDLIDWLNTYMEAMASLVSQHGGVVDDYAGDGMKANFGVPVPRVTEQEIKRDAVNAASCALAMEGEIERLNRRCAENGLPTVRMRIGIYTGEVVAGTLGGIARLKYTTVGDVVNIAARLESLDKEKAAMMSNGACRILVGDSTARYLDGRFLLESAGDLALKGKNQTVAAFCLRGIREELNQ